AELEAKNSELLKQGNTKHEADTKQLQNNKEINLIAKLYEENNQSLVNAATYSDESNDVSAKAAQLNTDVYKETGTLVTLECKCYTTPICTKSKSLEDKEMFDFLDQ
ncbi:13170_t:CDS:2, partial [Acaulospora morrowiae]